MDFGFFSDFSGDTWNFCGIRSCVDGFKVALDPVIQMSPARLRAVETDAFIVNPGLFINDLIEVAIAA